MFLFLHRYVGWLISYLPKKFHKIIGQETGVIKIFSEREMGHQTVMMKELNKLQ